MIENKIISFVAKLSNFGSKNVCIFFSFLNECAQFSITCLLLKNSFALLIWKLEKLFDSVIGASLTSGQLARSAAYRKLRGSSRDGLFFKFFDGIQAAIERSNRIDSSSVLFGQICKLKKKRRKIWQIFIIQPIFSDKVRPSIQRGGQK